MTTSKARSDGQVLKGLLDTLVLQVLSKADNYGFGLMQNIGDQLNGESLHIRETTLYPLLHRLEEKAFVETYFQPGDRGTPRKYYRITTTGRAHLQERLSEWRQVSAVLARTLLNDGLSQ